MEDEIETGTMTEARVMSNRVAVMALGVSILCSLGLLLSFYWEFCGGCLKVRPGEPDSKQPKPSTLNPKL